MAVPQAAAAEIEKQEDDTEGAVEVALFPRRKQGSSASMPTQRMPVKIDLAVLEALYGMPQPAAARALGIALTTLKQVCRKLGIKRWHYIYRYQRRPVLEANFAGRLRLPRNLLGTGTAMSAWGRGQSPSPTAALPLCA